MQRNIRLLSLHNFFTDFVFFAPVAIIYFAHVTGTYALGMSIFAVAYVSSALFEVPTGIISDLVGRKKTLILGSVFSVLCIVFYALGGSYGILFIGALCQGISRSFYSGNNDALLHDTLREAGKEEEYETYLGKTSSLFQVALATGAIIGSFLVAKSFALVLWSSVLPQIAALITSLFIIEPKIHSPESTNLYVHLKESVKQFQQNKKLRLLTIVSMIRFGVGESTYFLRAAFINTLWPLWAVGLADTVAHIGGAISFYTSGTVIKKFGAKRILQFEILANRAINCVALLFPTLLSPMLLTATSFTFGFGEVAMNNLLQKEFTHAQRATMGSLNSFAGSIVFGIVACTIGTLADKIGLIYTLLFVQFILLAPLWFYSKIFKKTL